MLGRVSPWMGSWPKNSPAMRHSFPRGKETPAPPRPRHREAPRGRVLEEGHAHQHADVQGVADGLEVPDGEDEAGLRRGRARRRIERLVVGHAEERLPAVVVLPREDAVAKHESDGVQVRVVGDRDDLQRQLELEVVGDRDRGAPPEPHRGGPVDPVGNAAVGPDPLLELDASLGDELRLVEEEVEGPGGARLGRPEEQDEGEQRACQPCCADHGRECTGSGRAVALPSVTSRNAAVRAHPGWARARRRESRTR